MDHEKCHVFKPDSTQPIKRRRIGPRGLQKSWAYRHDIFQQAWGSTKSRIEDRLSQIHKRTTAEIRHFLNDNLGNVGGDVDGRMPAGIIYTGPNATSQGTIVEQLKAYDDSDGRRIFVSLPATSASNLKAALKWVNQKSTAATVSDDGDEDEDEAVDGPKGSRLLNYDLQILANHVRERKLKQVVLDLQDIEAFDANLLSELIEMLGYWHNRIPFVFLFSIATSVEFLQHRLSKGAVKCLAGKLFHTASGREEVEEVFQAIMDQMIPSCEGLWIGPALMSMILERQNDLIQNIDSMVNAAKYAYMSCFFANPLSIFLKAGLKRADVPSDHFEAVRHTDSFRALCEGMLTRGEASKVQNLLISDDELFEMICEQKQRGREAMARLLNAVDLVSELQSGLQSSNVKPISELYVQAASGRLQDSSAIRAMLLSIRKSPSNLVVDIVTKIAAKRAAVEWPREFESVTQIHSDLTTLLNAHSHSGRPLRSEDDIKSISLRTTVVAQKVGLSKQKAELSKEDAEYTAIVRRFTDVLEAYFAASLVEPRHLPFHEIFVYDLKSPYREAFKPRPRTAIERALSTPHDYLDCGCCAPDSNEGEGPSLSATQPATAVLYQLYLESGSLINGADLLQAFQALMGDERPEEVLALYQKALAELKYLGMLKSTRKRVDHVAKVAWKGL